MLDHAEVSWVATDGHLVLAIGARRPEAQLGNPPLIVWSSPDGVTWRRVADAPPALADVGSVGIAGQDGTFLVLGGASDGTTRLLHTADGVDWAAVDVAPFGGDAIASVVPYRGGWLAVGSQASTAPPTPGGRPEPARAWWSVDGTHWSRATVAEGPALWSIYPGAEGVLGIGSSECGGCISNANLWQGDGRAWRLLGPDRLQGAAYGSDGSRIVAWDWQGSGAFAWASDGVTWHPFGGPAKDQRSFGALVVGAKGLLFPMRSDTEPVDAGVLYFAAT
jgi:hypothetical protein